jgi:prolipoprotein diacylglyceryltransferase
VITLKDKDERMFNSFQACGYIGLAFAIGLAMALVWHQGLSYWIMITIILTAVLTFLALAAWSEFRTGKPRLIYYRYLLAALGWVAALLFALGYPLLPYLDVTILGIGLFVVCGRIGCLMVGCCHGRPHGWGVTYSKESATADFPEHLVGVRLFPVQAVESFWVLAIVLAGVVQVIGGQPSGSALSSYVVAYGLGRFGFEFLRGDHLRHYFCGVSEAQWTSLITTAAVVTAEQYGALPARSWHPLVSACMVTAILIVTVARAVSDSSNSSKARIQLYSRLKFGRGTNA